MEGLHYGLGLCAGIGGLELGIALALGERYRCVCLVEREGYCCATLARHMETGILDPAVIWDDLITFDGKPWRGIVSLVSAGFPCQPVSRAGKQEGTADERWLWPHIARILGEIQPRCIFLENVPGLRTAPGPVDGAASGEPVRGGALGGILGSLADLGYVFAWDHFRASALGAAHHRARWFLLGYAHGERCSQRRSPLPIDAPVADAQHAGDPLPLFAPGPGDRDHWRSLLERFPWLAPALTTSEVESLVCRMADGLPPGLDFTHRFDRLRALGNGVYPLVAATAYLSLRQRLSQSGLLSDAT